MDADTPFEASQFVTAGFVALPAAVALAIVFGCEWAGRRVGDDPTRRRRRIIVLAAAIAVWMLATWLAASSGVLRRFDLRPPPFVLLAAGVLAAGVGLAFSPVGRLLARGLPLAALVLFQGFRLPLELLMHRAYSEGVMPEQMSYEGWNFDIVTGVTAIALGLWLCLGRVPRWAVAAWNFGGFVLLAAIVSIAVASSPVFAAFGPDRLNVFVTYQPFIWLPAVCVAAALAGHLIVWRSYTSQPGR